MGDKRNEAYYRDKLVPIVKGEIHRLCSCESLTCPDIEAACDRIWDEYASHNLLSLVLYMKSGDELLDRHKVAACYMIACLKAHPIKVSADTPADGLEWLANDALAVAVSCAVLFGYLQFISDELERESQGCDGMSADLISDARRSVECGMRFDAFSVGCYTYLESVLSCLSSRPQNAAIMCWQ